MNKHELLFLICTPPAGFVLVTILAFVVAMIKGRKKESP